MEQAKSASSKPTSQPVGICMYLYLKINGFTLRLSAELVALANLCQSQAAPGMRMLKRAQPDKVS